MAVENEVKFQIKGSSLDEIKKKILFLGFSFVQKKNQKDYYFSPAHKSFAGTKKYYLRLRQEKKQNEFAYHIVRNNLQTEELEVYVDNGSNFFKILKLLDFRIDCVVKKERLAYRKGRINIMVDKIQGLGTFVEIESIGNFTRDIKERFNELINYFQLKSENKISGVGYPDLLMQKRNNS